MHGGSNTVKYGKLHYIDPDGEEQKVEPAENMPDFKRATEQEVVVDIGDEPFVDAPFKRSIAPFLSLVRNKEQKRYTAFL